MLISLLSHCASSSRYWWQPTPPPRVVERMSWKQRQEATAGAWSLLAQQPLSWALSAVGHSSLQMSTALSQRRHDCVELTLFLSVFFPSFPSPLLPSLSLCCILPFNVSGEEAHHRPVRGPEGWTQPDFLVRGPLWSHSGMDAYPSFHTPAQKSYYCLTYYHSSRLSITLSCSAPSQTLLTEVQRIIVLRILDSIFKKTFGVQAGDETFPAQSWLSGPGWTTVTAKLNNLEFLSHQYVM